MKIRARLFIKQTLSEGLSIIPENKVMHYLSSVMRLKSGENILLFNGIDGEWLAEFQILSRRDAILHILHQKRIQPLHIPILKLYFAP